MKHPKVLIVNGSASENSSNERLVTYLVERAGSLFACEVFQQLKVLPHFDPALSNEHTPAAISEIRERIAGADAVIICSPEYVFSIPSGLKNLIEWCVSTTIFFEKACGLITASAHGEKAHEELQRLMQTLGAQVKPDTTLLIQGIKGKINLAGDVTDHETVQALATFINALAELIQTNKLSAGKG